MGYEYSSILAMSHHADFNPSFGERERGKNVRPAGIPTQDLLN